MTKLTSKLTGVEAKALGIKDYVRRRSIMIAKFPKMTEKQITSELLFERKRFDVVANLNIGFSTYIKKIQDNPKYQELEKLDQFDKLQQLMDQEIKLAKAEKEKYREENKPLSYYLRKYNFRRDRFNSLRYQNLELAKLMREQKYEEACILAIKLFEEKQRKAKIKLKNKMLAEKNKKMGAVIPTLTKEFGISRQAIHQRLKDFDKTANLEATRKYLVISFLDKRKRTFGGKNKLTNWCDELKLGVDELINLAILDKTLTIYKLITTKNPTPHYFAKAKKFLCIDK